MSKKYFLITYGCQMNVADSERIASDLEKKGYRPARNMNEADLVLVNMCSVRQPAVNRVFSQAQKINELKKKGKKIESILTGCILPKDRKKFLGKFDKILHFENLLEIKPRRSDKRKAFVPISNGCNNACAYCAVPFTRGRLICRDHKKVIKEAKDAIGHGAREIWLLGQNVNDYQSPGNKSMDFAKLLGKIALLPGDFRIRFMSPNPKNFSDEMIDVMAKFDKVAKFLNLPVQSGDDKILKAMNRPSTSRHYKNLVEKIRKKIPDINLTTDIIVGFPGENKSQFRKTAKLCKEIKFNLAYISKYSPRPGTIAEKMKDNISLTEKKRREKILRNIISENLVRKNKNSGGKLIAVVGPTASGKSEMAVALAKKFGGEVISADSRQIYKGMDIGSGKITKAEMKSIPHHLLDIAQPKVKFTVASYQKLAMEEIEKIIERKKIPILCGGSGFYIQSVLDGDIIPPVKPDWKLRKRLEKKSIGQLFRMLERLDKIRAKSIDKNNPRRLIRAIEIVIKTKKRVPLQEKRHLPYPILMIGIKKTNEELKKAIESRLARRLKSGMIDEVKNLHKDGLSWKRLEEFGLEYRNVARYLQGKTSIEEMKGKIQKESEQYAKRQMTWFKRDKRIKWAKNQKEAEKLV